jgi:LPXTG-motif cell wall-anchored protein
MLPPDEAFHQGLQRRRFVKSIKLSRLALSSAVALLTAGAGLFADDHDKKTDVTTNVPIEVPGGVVLQPGTYMFKLMNVTGDRHVVQISSEDGKQTYAVTFTAAARRVEPTNKTALTFYEMPNGQPEAVKRWFWPGDYDGEEFLYTQKRAAEIAKLTNEKIPEAPEDQSPIQLATNTTAPAAPADTSNSPVASAATAAPAPVAAPELPAVAPEPPVQATEPQTVAQANTPAPAPIAAAPSDDQTPPLHSSSSASDNRTLPATASDMPLFALIGFSAISGAFLMKRIRRT